MLNDWLQKRVTVEEAETEHLVSDERLGEEPVAFGFQNDEWMRFVENLQDDDELWEFRSPPETWASLCGRAGYCIVRDGEIASSIITMLN